MKHIYYLLVISLFVNNIPAFSQFVISEYSSGISLDEAPYVNDFSKNNFSIILNGENQRVSINNEITNIPAEANSLFTINLEYGNVDMTTVTIVNENYYNTEFTNESSISFNVPDGIYDVLVVFLFNGTEYIVIKELVNVSGETNININIGEADNKIVHEILNETSEKMRPGINSYLLLGGYDIVNEALKFFLHRTIHLWGGNSTSTQDPIWTFNISDVSDRYQILNNIHGITNERVHYLPHFDAINGVSSSMEITNDPDKFVYHEETINPTPWGENSTFLRPAISFHKLWKNHQFSIGTYYENGQPSNTLFKSYLGSDLSTRTSNTATLASFGFLEDQVNNFSLYFLRGNQISVSGDEIIYGSANLYPQTNFLSNYHLLSDSGQGVYPFHNKFSFSASSAVDIKQGKNTPILSTSMRFGKLLSGYTGRYAESRESDFATTTAEVYMDGELVMSGNYMEVLNLDLSSPSLFEIKLLNTNIDIDGINGKNSAQIIFDNNLADNNPPSLKMLQFRSEDGIVKDRFLPNEIPVARIAAGDFYFENNIYLKYKEGNSIEFFYSLMNQENWNEVQLINYPEHFTMPGYGDYYEASLAGIQPTGNDVWYDVKVICTDAAGNKQIQTISPAFKLNSTLQTEEIGEEYDFVVYPNPFNDNLNIQLPKNIKGNYIVKLTDLTGRIISSEAKKPSDPKSLFYSFLPKGNYVLSIESNGITLAKKVIKK